MLSACLLISFFTGCDKYQRHSVLTFFFTGVPPVDGVITANDNSNSGVKTADAREAKSKIPQIPSFVHGPYAARQCQHCHSTASSATFRSFVRKQSGTAGTQGGGIGSRLIMPLEELCIDCHTSKSVEYAFLNNLWIHGPVSKGLCTECHSPHQTTNRYMVLKEKSTELCGKCHAKGFIIATEDHDYKKECISCHNPHLGKDRYLLKRDFDEMF